MNVFEHTYRHVDGTLEITMSHQSDGVCLELKDDGPVFDPTSIPMPDPEILAASGGMFYPREAPGMDVFVNEGDHFEAGDTLYIVEVMKMFNKVVAPFAGTIEKVLIDGDGVIIKKGQPLFKVNPDEKIEVETPEQIAAARRASTDGFLAGIAG